MNETESKAIEFKRGDQVVLDDPESSLHPVFNEVYEIREVDEKLAELSNGADVAKYRLRQATPEEIAAGRRIEHPNATCDCCYRPAQKLRNYGWDRYLMSINLTLVELESLEKFVTTEHANDCVGGRYFENGQPTMHLIDSRGRKKLDAIGWAIYNITKRQQSNLKVWGRV